MVPNVKSTVSQCRNLSKKLLTILLIHSDHKLITKEEHENYMEKVMEDLNFALDDYKRYANESDTYSEAKTVKKELKSLEKEFKEKGLTLTTTDISWMITKDDVKKAIDDARRVTDLIDSHMDKYLDNEKKSMAKQKETWDSLFAGIKDKDTFTTDDVVTLTYLIWDIAWIEHYLESKY